MLPDHESHERREIQAEAVWVARKYLDEEHGNIGAALNRTFEHFLERFADESELEHLTLPDSTRQEALLDARQITAYVSDAWTAAIKHVYAAALRLGS